MVQRSTNVLLRPGIDTVVDALGDQQRRMLLYELNNGNVDHERDVMMRSRSEIEIESELQHTHLPKLEKAGYIEWDQEAGTISKGRNWHEIAPLLDLIEDHSDELPSNWP